jgi:hypothetical protein
MGRNETYVVRDQSMAQSLHPAASHHLPFFITAPGETDVLMWLMGIVLVASMLGVGVFFFWLHSLPERMVHHRVQFDIVAVLCLLSLLTHIHAFWVAALLLALVRFPDLSSIDVISPLGRIAGALERATNLGPTKPIGRDDAAIEKERL